MGVAWYDENGDMGKGGCCLNGDFDGELKKNLIGKRWLLWRFFWTINSQFESFLKSLVTFLFISEEINIAS